MALDLSALDGWELNPQRRDGGVAARAALSLIEEDPANPRFEHVPEDFEALIEDVRVHGILQPIVVRRLPNGKLRIRFGARRYRAAVRLGLAEIPYVLTEDPRQFDDYAQVAENERRTALQPLELATFIAKKLREGDSKSKIAARLGIHPSALTHLLCLVGDVPPFLLELYHSRRCRSSQYLYRLTKLWKVDPLRIQDECAAAGEIDARMIAALELRASENRRNRSLGKIESLQKNTCTTAHETSLEDSVRTAGVHANSIAGVASRSLPKRKARRFQRLRMTGNFNGRPVEIDLPNGSSNPTTVIIRFIDELIVLEVPLRELVLTRLVELS